MLKVARLVVYTCSVLCMASAMIVEDDVVVDAENSRMLTGIPMPSNLVLITAQKQINSKFCLGLALTTTRILTTASCVQDSFQLLVQHDDKDDGSFDFTILVAPEQVVICDKYNETGHVNNIAIIKLTTALDTVKFKNKDYILLPTKNDHPLVQLRKNIDYKYFVFATMFSSHFSRYPAVGSMPNYELVPRAECQGYNKKPSIELVGEDGEGEYCITTAKNNTLCAEDEGGAVTAIKGTDFVLIGLVNINARECAGLQAGSLDDKQKHSFIVPISLLLPWIEAQLV